MKWLNRVKSFLRSSNRRKLLFIQVIALSIFRGMLRILGSKNAFTENLLTHTASLSMDSPSLLQEEAARDIAFAIELGRKYIPWENRCRHQAWQAVVLLQRECIPFTYHVGLKKESANRSEGHAWVLVNGRFISGKCKLSDYVEIKF